MTVPPGLKGHVPNRPAKNISPTGVRGGQELEKKRRRRR